MLSNLLQIQSISYLLSIFLTIGTQVFAYDQCREVYSLQNFNNQLNKSEYSIFRSSEMAIEYIDKQQDFGFDLYDFEFLISRSDFAGANLPEHWTEKSTVKEWSRFGSFVSASSDRSAAIDFRNNTLLKLYGAYSNQGPERNTQIKNYSDEDFKAADRTTHITLVSHEEPIAHFQAQHSFSEDQPLNLENHFPEAKTFIRSTKGSLVVELGRITILKPADTLSRNNKILLKSKIARDRIFTDIWLRMTSWLKKLDPSTVVVFQVNDSMFDLIKIAFSPLKMSETKEVRLSPDLPREWIVKLNMKQIGQLQEIMFKKKMSFSLSKFMETNADELVITTEPTEASLLENFGAYELNDKYVARYTTQENNSGRARNGLLPIQPLRINKTTSKSPFTEKSHLIRLGKEEARQLLENLSK